MDVGLPGNTRRDRFAGLERIAALGFDELTFRVKVPRDLELVDTVRVDVAITSRGRGFQTIQIDLGPADEATVDLIAPTIRGVAELGIPVTSPIRCITLDRVVEGENRVRDILDVVFLDVLGQLDPKAVQSACIRVFEQRAEHAWPPSIDIPPGWRVELASLARLANRPGCSLRQAIQEAAREFTARRVTTRSSQICSTELLTILRRAAIYIQQSCIQNKERAVRSKLEEL